MKHIAAIMVALGAVFCAYAEKQPFERYQPIIDRMPFGQPPPGFDPTRDPSEVSKDEYANAQTELTQEQEAIQKAVRFSVINVENDGTVRVGFTDVTDPKAPRHFYLAVGEVRGGWTVKSADATEKKMTVVKDGVEVELALGENSGSIDGKAVAGARNSTRQQRSPLLGRSGGAGGETGAPMSMRGRRERREAEEAARRAEDAKLAEEREREKAERERREEEERAAREAERAEQREQLNALKAELMRQREEAKARDNGGDETSEDEDESTDE